jgi:hypothetical protein
MPAPLGLKPGSVIEENPLETGSNHFSSLAEPISSRFIWVAAPEFIRSGLNLNDD